MLRSLLLAGAIPLVLIGCGDDDSSAPRVDDDVAATDDDAETGDAEVGPAGIESSDDLAQRCDSAVTLEEVETLFGSPAAPQAEGVGTGEINEALGQTLCSWAATDDTSSLLVVQLYDGTIAGESFYDPDGLGLTYDEIDLADEGYVSVGDHNVDVAWLSSERAGFVSWSDVDIGRDGATGESMRDAVVQLARAVHDRAD